MPCFRFKHPMIRHFQRTVMALLSLLLSRVAALLLAFSMATFAGDPTLQRVYEAQMKDDGCDGHGIIHIQKNASDGWVMDTSWTEEYPDNRNDGCEVALI